MTQPALFDLPAELRWAVRPACHVCGAVGPLIVEDPTIAPKPHLAALVELDRHLREMHPEDAAEASGGSDTDV